MSENDVLGVLIVATATVKLATLLLRYRAGQRAADRKKEATKP